MFKNYMLVTLRNIKRHKGYSLINIASLAIGMVCCVLMLLWVQDELGYDGFHENADRIYRVIRETNIGGKVDRFSTIQNPAAPLLKTEYPEIAEAVRFRGGYTEWPVQYGEKIFINDRIGGSDPAFFQIFTFPFLKGDAGTALNDPKSVVISESTAKKYFGNEEAMGKIIKVNRTDFKVTGVINDVPYNSHIQFDLLVPLINMRDWWNENLEDWNRDFELHTYVLLKKDNSPHDLGRKIAGIVKKHLPESDTTLYLQPLKDIYLYSTDLKYDNTGLGNITYVYIFSLTAFCILLIGCINFMNLSTARAGARAKEIGMRKAAGAHRFDIIKQFFGESIIFSFIALVLALILVFLFLPVFNELSGKQLSLFGSLTGNFVLILQVIAITLLTAFIAGSYPSFFLSSFQPISVIKDIAIGGKRRGAFLRKLLVVFQFAFTVILILGLILIYSQLHFIESKNLGFNKDNILYFWGEGKFVTQIDAVKNELLQNPNILAVSKATPPIVELMTVTDIDWEGKKVGDKVAMSPGLVDFDYLKLFDLKMVEGRFFSKAFPADVSNYIINETAAKAMGIKSPLGLRLTFGGPIQRQNREGRIIGVMKDFHQHSLYKPIPPIVFMVHRGQAIICIKIGSKNVPDTINFLKNAWDKFVGGEFPFNYQFLDETIANFYREERRTVAVVKYFTFLAIFISSIGLLGLVSYMAEQKTKEIGIRKVMGASVSSIVMLLSKGFLKLIIAAILIACPLAWYVMNRWLQSYAYRTGIEWWMFALTGAAALAIGFLTVSYQAIKSASANPIDSLRYE